VYSGSPRYDGEAAAARTLRHTRGSCFLFLLSPHSRSHVPAVSPEDERCGCGCGCACVRVVRCSQAGGRSAWVLASLACAAHGIGGGSPTPRLPTPIPNTHREREIGRSVGCLDVFMTRKKKLLVSGCVYPDPEHMHTRPGDTAHHNRAREPHAYVPSSPRRHPSSQRAEARGAVPCGVQVPGGGGQLCLPYLCRARAGRSGDWSVCVCAAGPEKLAAPESESNEEPAGTVCASW
jgi:hypothetical protein